MTNEISLLVNAGVAGVFAVFAILIVREFIKFISDQNKSWQLLVKELTTGQKDLAVEMKALAAIIARLKDSVDECPKRGKGTTERVVKSKTLSSASDD